MTYRYILEATDKCQNPMSPVRFQMAESKCTCLDIPLIKLPSICLCETCALVLFYKKHDERQSDSFVNKMFHDESAYRLTYVLHELVSSHRWPDIASLFNTLCSKNSLSYSLERLLLEIFFKKIQPDIHLKVIRMLEIFFSEIKNESVLLEYGKYLLVYEDAKLAFSILSGIRPPKKPCSSYRFSVHNRVCIYTAIAAIKSKNENSKVLLEQACKIKNCPANLMQLLLQLYSDNCLNKDDDSMKLQFVKNMSKPVYSDELELLYSDGMEVTFDNLYKNYLLDPSSIASFDFIEYCFKLKKSCSIYIRAAFEVLDFNVWHVQRRAWETLQNCLTYAIVTEEENALHIFKKCWKGRSSWWPRYHFRCFDDLWELKLPLAIIFLGYDNRLVQRLPDSLIVRAKTLPVMEKLQKYSVY